MPAIPLLLPAAKIAIPAALSAFGASKNKPQEVAQTRNLEPDYFSNFRKSLIGPYGSMLAKAGQPMYGNAERAGFMNTLNRGSANAEKNLAGRLAQRTGSLNSGAYSSGLTDIFMNRLGKEADYEAQIPMLNKEAYFKNMGSTLDMGMKWAGRAPVDQNRTETKSNGSFLSNFAGGLGAIGANAAGKGGGFPGLDKLFGGGQASGQYDWGSGTVGPGRTSPWAIEDQYNAGW